MRDVNKSILVGRLGHSPELRQTKAGPMARFNLATSRRIPELVTIGEDGTANTRPMREETEWHRVIVWGPQALTCNKFLSKGDTAYVEGSMRYRKFKTKEGTDRWLAEVFADSVNFLGRRTFGVVGNKGADASVEESAPSMHSIEDVSSAIDAEFTVEAAVPDFVEEDVAV